MNRTKLAAAAKQGDRDAFISIVKDIESSLFNMAKSILHHDEDVADVLQETILKAYKSIHTLREPKFFKTWAVRILINECNRLLANRSKVLPFAEVPISSPSASVSDEYDNVDLREAVDRLDEQQRIVVILYYYGDMSLRDVADSLEISESAVKMRLSRARNTLLKNINAFRERKMNYESI